MSITVKRTQPPRKPAFENVPGRLYENPSGSVFLCVYDSGLPPGKVRYVQLSDPNRVMAPMITYDGWKAEEYLRPLSHDSSVTITQDDRR